MLDALHSGNLRRLQETVLQGWRCHNEEAEPIETVEIRDACVPHGERVDC